MIVRNLTIRRNFPVLARIDAGFQLGYSGVGSGPRQGGGLTCGGTFRGSRCLHATDLRRTPLSPGSRCASTPPRTSCLPVSRSAERRAPSCRESPESPQDASGRFPAPGAVRAAVAARIPQRGSRAAFCVRPPKMVLPAAVSSSGSPDSPPATDSVGPCRWTGWGDGEVGGCFSYCSI